MQGQSAACGLDRHTHGWTAPEKAVASLLCDDTMQRVTAACSLVSVAVTCCICVLVQSMHICLQFHCILSAVKELKCDDCLSELNTADCI